MKRKLINYDVFQMIENDSITNAEDELFEAQQVLAESLGLADLSLRFFGVDNVVYETLDNTFIHANYSLKNNQLVFENIEELVIDQESEKNKLRQIVTNMVDALMENNTDEANDLFNEFMGLPGTKRVMREGFDIATTVTKGTGKRNPWRGGHRPGGKAAARKAWLTRKKNERQHPGLKSRMKRLRDRAKNQLGGLQKTGKGKDRRVAVRFVKESKFFRNLNALCENVANYLSYKNLGSVLNESNVQLDEKGNAITVSIPSKAIKNKHKMQEFDWKVLSADGTVNRMSAKKLSENTAFCKAVVDLKRHNAMSDNDALEETLENIVSRWANVIYLTEAELAGVIKSALETAGAKNYGDQHCAFMAEGILRVAHNAYVDKVNKILNWAGANSVIEGEDKYKGFKNVVDEFYPTIDESNKVEMQAYVDVYEALRHIYDMAEKQKDEYVKTETANYLDDLLPILHQTNEPDLAILEAAVEWLVDLIETNLDMEDWAVSNTPHNTVSGDHPRMNQIASKGYSPAADFSGDWGDVAPVSDGKSTKNGLADDMRNSSWGNVGGADTYPTLDNPYLLKPFGDYEIKGEKTIDDDEGLLGHVSNSDTWPGLQNPYVPQSVTPQSYKMKNGEGTDLVVDK